MCARFLLAAAEKTILQAYAAEMVAPYMPNYNIAPTQRACVITADEPNLIQQYHFGLVPHLAREKKEGMRALNARQETVMELKTFKPLMEKNKRCLVLADSFIEWDKVGEGKAKCTVTGCLTTIKVGARLTILNLKFL